MPRNVSGAYQSKLSGTVLQLAICIKITRRDNKVFGLTGCDRDLLFGGLIYESTDGTDITAIRQQIQSGVDNLELSGVIKSNRIRDVDLLGGLYDNAALEIFQVFWSDTVIVDRLILGFGYLGEITFSEGGYHAEFRSLSSRLGQQIGELSSPTCRVVQLGDSRCTVPLLPVAISAITQANPAVVTTAAPHGRSVGQAVYFSDVGGMTGINNLIGVIQAASFAASTFSVNIDATGFAAYTSGGQIGWQFTRSVASVTSPLVITFGSATFGLNLFQYGKVTFTSGLNNGLSQEIKSHALTGGQAVLTLQEAFPFVVAVGDTATLEAGCDRTTTICNQRFANVVNFQGENAVPGTDFLVKRGRR